MFNFIPGEQESIVMAGWAVGVEVLFYIIFPVFYRICDTRQKSLLLFLGSMVLSTVARLLIPDETFYKWSILRHAPVFTAGMLLFSVIQKMQTFRGVTRKLLGVVLCAGFVLAFVFRGKLAAIPGMDYYSQLIPFGLLLAGLALTPLPILVSPATAFLGKISFSMYLLHPLLVVNMAHIYPQIYALHLDSTLTFILCAWLTLALLLPLAYISYVYIEQPGISLGKLIVGRATGARVNHVQ